jgi:hypothetical protein
LVHLLEQCWAHNRCSVKCVEWTKKSIFWKCTLWLANCFNSEEEIKLKVGPQTGSLPGIAEQGGSHSSSYKLSAPALSRPFPEPVCTVLWLAGDGSFILRYGPYLCWGFLSLLMTIYLSYLCWSLLEVSPCDETIFLPSLFTHFSLSFLSHLAPPSSNTMTRFLFSTLPCWDKHLKNLQFVFWHSFLISVYLRPFLESLSSWKFILNS